MPYLTKNDVGTWCVRTAGACRPDGEPEAEDAEARQPYLRRSLGTDNKREANHRAKLALQILNKARALANLPGPTCRDSLNAAEIARMSEAFFVKMLADDEAYRFGGRAYMAQLADWIRRNEDPSFEPPYALKSLPEFGW